MELVHSAPNHAGPRVCQFKKKEIAKMLDLEVVERTKTEWASHIVLAQKTDCAVQLCIDSGNATKFLCSIAVPFHALGSASARCVTRRVARHWTRTTATAK